MTALAMTETAGDPAVCLSMSVSRMDFASKIGRLGVVPIVIYAIRIYSIIWAPVGGRKIVTWTGSKWISRGGVVIICWRLISIASIPFGLICNLILE